MTTEKQKFIEQIAPYAMEEQIKYGIPASVTISQAIFESKYGLSDMAKECKNLFGIKANGSWLSAGKPYGVYDDDRPNEKFCKYSNFEASIDHHSRILMDGRYMQYCKNLSPTDHMGWLNGLQKGGYATKKDYAASVSGDINPYKLYEYDKKAMAMAAQRGVTCGYLRGQATQTIQQSSINNSQSNGTAQNDGKTHLSYIPGNFAMPIDMSKVKVSSEFNDTKGRNHAHKGIDLSTNQKYLDIVATEDNGKVVAIKPNNGNAGNMITIEYKRLNQPAVQVTYMHLSEFNPNLHKDSIVHAGQILGKSGNTGLSTGPHLHLEVNIANENGEFSRNGKIDPTQYLAELQVRTGQNIALKADGQSDYLASAKSKMVVDRTDIKNLQGPLAQKTGSNDPRKWLQYLKEQNNDFDHSKDALSSLLSHYFTNAFVSLVAIVDQEEAKRLDEEIKASDAKEKSNDIYHPLETVSAKEASQLAASNYNVIMNQEEESQAQRQTTNVKLS